MTGDEKKDRKLLKILKQELKTNETLKNAIIKTQGRKFYNIFMNL